MDHLMVDLAFADVARLMTSSPRCADRVDPLELILPGVAALNLTLAETPRSVIALTALSADPTGFAFRISTVSRRPVALPPPPGVAPPAAAGLTCRVEFSDGSVAELGDDRPRPADRPRPTDDRPRPADDRPRPTASPPAPPVLRRHTDEVHGSVRTTEFRVWPLPPAGPVAFVCRWPAGGVGEAWRQIDADVIHEAASRAILLASDPPGSGGRSPDDVA
jgi:hypothetical protein